GDNSTEPVTGHPVADLAAGTDECEAPARWHSITQVVDPCGVLRIAVEDGSAATTDGVPNPGLRRGEVVDECHAANHRGSTVVRVRVDHRIENGCRETLCKQVCVDRHLELPSDYMIARASPGCNGLSTAYLAQPAALRADPGLHIPTQDWIDQRRGPHRFSARHGFVEGDTYRRPSAHRCVVREECLVGVPRVLDIGQKARLPVLR